jgi:outer membrane protein assembly factor BamB
MNGNVRWKRDLQTDSDRKPPQWGFSSSPLVHDGLVVVHAGGSADRGVMAYDAATGEPRWSVPSGDHSYSSPHAAAFHGVTGILMQTNDGLQFLNPADGATLWNHEWKGDNYRVTQPLVIGNSVLLATSLGIGTRRITILRKDDRWETVEDWTTNEMKPDFNDFVEYQGHLYGFDGNIFSCLDLATGKRLWKRGRYGNGQVLQLPDDGQLLVISESGEVILLRASPEKLIEVQRSPRNRLLSERQIASRLQRSLIDFQTSVTLMFFVSNELIPPSPSSSFRLTVLISVDGAAAVLRNVRFLISA